MKDIIFFSVPGSDSIRELQLGQTLIGFSQFDLAYFREQCVGAYRKSAPDVFLDRVPHLKEYINGCHPYYGAMSDTDLGKVALDCVIDDICLTDGVGLEELWHRNIKGQDRLALAMFGRITEYKTGRAINQWTNLVRMQSYARSKMSFIYDGADAEAVTHKARKLYYDLAFAMTAAELGYGREELPKTEVAGVPLLEQGPTAMKSAFNTLTPAVKAMTKALKTRPPLRGDECVRDQMAGKAVNILAGIKRPRDEDIEMMALKYGALPNQVYMPSGLKAVLDLEFDQMFEKGFFISIEGENRTLREYAAKEGAPVEQETRPDAPVETPPSETVKKPAAKKKGTPRKKKQPEKEALSAGPEQPEESAETAVIADQAQPVKVRAIIEMAEDPNRQPSQDRTLQEVNMRCNLIWMNMNVQTGWNIAPEDSSEWFRYLTRLRYGIGTGELTAAALDKFLDATLEVYKLLPEEA